MPSSAPIGVFDSGIGGLSVLATLRAALPGEDYCYFGDTAKAPYGVRPPEEILALTRAAVGGLMKARIKALVIACNTATGVAGEALALELPIPVVGIQPALAAAQEKRGGGEALVLATPATFRTARYQALRAAHGEGLIDLPAPGLMEFVERGELSGGRLDAFLAALFAPLSGRDIRVVVLGCTHYPFLSGAIQPFFPQALLMDDSPRVARQLREELTKQDLLSPCAAQGSLTLASSGGEPAIARMRGFLPAE
ncbi:MAG: glutamate racemase [Christensenellales bacterium]